MIQAFRQTDDVRWDRSYFGGFNFHLGRKLFGPPSWLSWHGKILEYRPRRCHENPVSITEVQGGSNQFPTHLTEPEKVNHGRGGLARLFLTAFVSACRSIRTRQTSGIGGICTSVPQADDLSWTMLTALGETRVPLPRLSPRHTCASLPMSGRIWFMCADNIPRTRLA